MGYTSEVHGIIYGEPEIMDALIAKERLAGDAGIFGMFDEADVDGLSIHELTRTRYIQKPDTQENERVEVKIKLLSLYGSSWKWYDDFKDVQHWEALMREAEEMGLEYEMARIGEERDDMEVSTSENAEYFLNISRSIDADF
jgi:hypothetical protein